MNARDILNKIGESITYKQGYGTLVLAYKGKELVANIVTHHGKYIPHVMIRRTMQPLGTFDSMDDAKHKIEREFA